MKRSILSLFWPLLVIGAFGLMAAGTADAASSHETCSCSGGQDKWGRQIPASETYCGYLTCGTSNQKWECTASGWKNIGYCGSGSCYCSGGRDEWDEPIPLATTYCGFETPANNLDIYQCNWSSQWQYVRSGNFCDVCTCYDGRDQFNNPISPSSTYCGYTTTGVNGNRWQCTAAGWDLVNGTTSNAKFGINSAVPLDHPNSEDSYMIEADQLGLGWYQMLIGHRQDWNEIDWRITPALQKAHQRGLTPILRLCTATGCQYQNNVGSLVNMLNSQYIADNVNSDYYVILGPNEPPTEKWMTPSTQALTPNCGTNNYCVSQLNQIASEMAAFAHTALSNVQWSKRVGGGGDIAFLSPVFDCHNTLNTPELMIEFANELSARGRSFLSFDAIGMNVYNLDGQDAKYYFDRCKGWLQTASGINSSSFDYIITETGMLEVERNGIVAAVGRNNFRDSNERLRNDGTIDGILFFNPQGRNGEFTYNDLDQTCEWTYVLGGR